MSPERQRELADLLAEATRRTMNRLPGYVSADIHRSLDGTRVVNYAQWRRVDDFEAMLRDPAAREHMTLAEQVADSFEPHLYEVDFTDQAGEPGRP